MSTGRVSVGHPIDVASGAQYTAAHDIEVAGHMPLTWRRAYSTARVGREPGILGRGWVHFFDMHFQPDLEGYRFFGHDGDEVVFDDPNDTVEKGGSVLSLGDHMELRLEGNFYAIYHWHDWRSDVRKFLFPAGRQSLVRLAAVEVPCGHRVGVEYDARGRISELRQFPEGRRLLLDYNSDGLLDRLQFASPISQPEEVATYEYDRQKRLVAVFDAQRTPIRYAYDSDHRLIRESSRAGNVYEMKYDDRGRCIEATGYDGYGRRSLHFDDATRMTTVTDSLGNKTIYQANDRGQIVNEALPNGSIRVKKFDDYGRLVESVGSLGETRKHRYGDRGDLVEVTYPNGAAIRFEFNRDHQPVSIEQPGGGRWQLQYERGAVVAIVDPAESITRYDRNAENVIRAIHTPRGNVVRISHNRDWTEEAYEDDQGLLVRRRLDARLKIVEIANANGVVRRFTYDGLGRLVAIIEADGVVKRYERDRAAQVLRYIDANGRAWSQEYSPYSDTIRSTDPNGLSHRYEYDTEGRLIRVTNPKGETATYEFDAMGNILRHVSFDGREEVSTFDFSGNCLTRTLPDGVTLKMTYDACFHLLQVTDGTVEWLTNVFDPQGRLVETATPSATVQFEYDSCGRLTGETQNGHHVAYSYYPSGDIARRQFDGGRNGPLTFEYDRRGQLSAIGNGQQTYQRMLYDHTGLMIERQLAGFSERREYDARRRMQRQRLVPRKHEVVIRDYGYDAEDNLLRVSDTLRGETNYEYDAGYRLIRVTHSTRGTVSHRYDPCGNLMQNGNVTLDYAAGNRLIRNGNTTLDHDANGRVISATSPDGVTQYVWNPLGQLVEVIHPGGDRTRYGYDGLGRRVIKDQNGRETRYYWACNDLLSEHSPDGVIDYAIGEFVPDILWENGEIRHVVIAHVAMPYELLDRNGDLIWVGDYNEWGQLIGQEARGGSNLIRLPGQYADGETGLHYNRYRFYDPSSFTFLSPDPIGLRGGMNEYLYAPNAINWSDPFGLECGKKNCDKNSVYILTKGDPPEIVYVGITAQTVEERAGQHARGSADVPKKDYDHMTVIATGLDRRDARNIEGSALYNINQGNVVSGNTGQPITLLNATRNDGGSYHSYGPDSGSISSAHQLFTPAESINQLNQDVKTIPNPTH